MAELNCGYYYVIYSVTTTDTTVTCTITDAYPSSTAPGSGYATESDGKVHDRIIFDGASLFNVSLKPASDSTARKAQFLELLNQLTQNVTSKVYAGTAKRTWTRGKTATTGTLQLSIQGYYSRTVTINVPAKPSYAVTYNANGGSGAPSSQTKWYGEALTLSTTKPTRTNYVFKNWLSGTGTSYAPGANYTANAALALTAQWYPPYTVTPNANGGTLASVCSVLTKVHNAPLTLWAANLNPTRTDFAFVGWNTAASGGGTSYAAGASYTANANATLYAKWERTYADPNVSVVSVQRVDATTHESDDMGESVEVTVAWALFDTPSGTNHPTSIVVECNGVTATLTGLTGTTGTATAYLDASCSVERQYEVTATLTDEGGASRAATAEGVVTTPYYPIDIYKGGKGVAIGGPSTEDALDIFMPTKILPRSTSASETPLAINDGTDDVFAIDWDGRPSYGIDVSTAVLSDILTAATDVTFTRANYAQSGRVAMLELRFTLASAISVPAGGNITDITIGTLVSGKRPTIACHPSSNGDGAGASSYYINPNNGAILLCAVEGTGAARTINAGGEFTLAVTYIVA